MNKTVQDTLDFLYRRIEEVIRIKEDVELAESLIPACASMYLTDSVDVIWPARSMNEVRELLAAFAKAGCLLERYEHSGVRPKWYIKGKKALFCLAPVWCDEKNSDGATCRLVQVGFEPSLPTPIYKLVCDEKK